MLAVSPADGLEFGLAHICLDGQHDMHKHTVLHGAGTYSSQQMQTLLMQALNCTFIDSGRPSVAMMIGLCVGLTWLQAGDALCCRNGARRVVVDSWLPDDADGRSEIRTGC